MDNTGLIIKGIGGFYYVRTADGNTVTCKARGVFRKAKITPLVGDKVRFSMVDDEEGVIDEIIPRKNSLVRPPVANIDRLFIVSSVRDPSPSTLIIDKTIAAAEIKDIEPVLVITKTDMGEYDQLKEIYSSVGIKTVFVSSVTKEGTEEVRELLKGCISAFTGNSGVGKSTLLNAIMPELFLETGETSKKLGRGRHTTRHVELFEVESGGYVADTPGFSTMDMERYDLIEKEKLPFAFREFEPYLGECKFTSCSHTCEKGCAVLEAVKEGKIKQSRMDSYIAMYNEVKDIKQWQIQKNV